MPLITSNPSISSPLLSASPTSEPSKYIAHDPVVLLPKDTGVKANISSSLPETPGTEGLPVVEIKMRPSGSTLNESILSLVVLRPTSLPSMYMLNVPAVVVPSDVASKRTISWGAIVRPPTVMALLKDIRMVSESTTDMAKTSTLPNPTSEPSNSMLQFCPLKYRISSSVKERPSTVPLDAKET